MKKSISPFTLARTATALAIATAGMAASPAWAACSYEPLLKVFIGDTCASSTSSSSTYANWESFLKANPTPRLLIASQLSSISGMATARRNAALAASGNASLPGQTGLSASAADSRWNGWAAASSNSTAYTFTPLNSSGRVNSLLVGLDYSYRNGALAGVALGADSSNTSTTFNNGSIGTSGTTVAPYFMVPLASDLLIDGSIGFGSGRLNSNFGGGITGSTTEVRNFAALGLTKFMNLGKWQVAGNAQLLSSGSRAKAFTLSNATAINEASSGVTQLRMGARGSYGSGQFVPYMGLTYSQDLNRPDIAPIAGQAAANARGAFIAQAGVNINQTGVFSGSVGLTSEMRKETRNTGLVATISMKF
jgi:Autotransporter beta-domain